MKTTTTRLNELADTYRLGSNITAFTTTRQGGCSKGNYASMNVNAFCGDNPDDTKRNRQTLCDILQIASDRLVMPHQTHDKRIALVDNNLLKLPEQERNSALEGTDALMTRERGVCIGVSTADCTPIILYDGEHHAACVVHAGWRGTVKRIAAEAVTAMNKDFGTDSSQLAAVIGPCISLDSFEVGDEVYQAFHDAGFPMQQISRRRGKWHIDLKACNSWLLQESGVAACNIHVSPICTYSQPERYFSARRLGIASGRLLTAILLR